MHLRELGIIVSVAAVYSTLRAWAQPEDPSLAVANALDVVAIELKANLFLESALQGLLLGPAWLIDAMNWYYLAMHLPPVAALLLYTYLWRPDAWPFLRDAMIAFTLFGLVLHIVYPVAPPWFVERLGVADTFAEKHAIALGTSTAGNPFAAMPSMHFGWALAAGAGFAMWANALWARILGVLHPIVMGVTIVATGNHYVLDVVASVALLGLAVGGVALIRGWPEIRVRSIEQGPLIDLSVSSLLSGDR